MMMVDLFNVAGFTTVNFTVNLKYYKALSMRCSIFSTSFFSLKIHIYIHAEEGVFFTVVHDSFPNFSSILSAIIYLTMKPIRETLLSSTNHLMVHWFELIGIHCSYGLNLNPKLDNVVDIRSYHNRKLSIILQISFRIRTYSTFCLFYMFWSFCTPDSLQT